MNRENEEQNEVLNQCINKSMTVIAPKTTALLDGISKLALVEVSAVQQKLITLLSDEMKAIKDNLQEA